MNYRTLFAALALLALPGLAAADFDYNSAEFGYVDVNYDVGPVDVDGNGFRLAGRYTLADSFFIAGRYDDYDFDFGLDGSVLEITGGYFYSFGEDLDFVATLTYVDRQLSVNGFGGDDNGLGVAGGVRSRLSDAIQVDAMLRYVDMDAGDTDTSLELRGRYYFNDSLAVQASASLGGDFETLGIGIHAEF